MSTAPDRFFPILGAFQLRMRDLHPRAFTMGKPWRLAAATVLLAAIHSFSNLLSSPTLGQESGFGLPPRSGHPLVNADMPPGALGAIRLMNRGPGQVQNYYQPVEIFAPEGTQISLAIPGGFSSPSAQPLKAGMLVGSVYRLQLTQIPLQPGVEVFPTIEVIDRLYPPPGQETAFPIPVHLDTNDINDALAGRLVTRVVYLEDPQTALPMADEPNTQRTLDIPADRDPLAMADRLGRPVAVLRIGSLAPPSSPDLLPGFLLGSPPWIPIMSPNLPSEAPAGPVANQTKPGLRR